MSVMDPTYLGDIFSGGLPTASATGADTATYDPAQVGAGPSTDAITQALMAALAPSFASQNRGLTESLANAGIVGGSTTGAVDALGEQQQTQALASMAPYIMQGYSMQQARDLANQDATNASRSQGASAANQQNDFNASAANATSQFNTSNQLQAGQADQNAANTSAGELAIIQNQDYLAQFGAQANQIAQGAAGATGAYQPVFQQPAPVNYGGFASAITSGFKPTASTSTPSTTTTTTPANQYGGGGSVTPGFTGY